MKYYKFLNKNGSTPQGYGAWHSPKGKRPGKWMQKIEGELILCQNGYHVLRSTDLISWLGPVLWEVEVSGKVIADDNKCVVRRARLIKQVDTWNKETAVQFAIECAEKVLPIFEKQFPNDKRPRKAIEAAKTGNAAYAEAAAAYAAYAANAAYAAANAANAAYAAERQWQSAKLIDLLGIPA